MQKYLQLFKEQIASWPLAADNYRALSSILVKDFELDGLQIRLQYNPGRITSSTAIIDKSVIQVRSCFLCEKNRPKEQRGIPFSLDRTLDNSNSFQILINPFPVFSQHFTIAATEHQPQYIQHHLEEFLNLAQTMKHCVVFYNGPQCGASAPDHLHFQAGNKGIMPIETEYKKWIETCTNLLSLEKGFQIYSLNLSSRNGWLFKGKDTIEMIRNLEVLYEVLSTNNPTLNLEPMLNLLCWYEEGTWFCIVFPRQKHRPDCYFREDGSKLLISPASVEMGGLIVCARLEDFEKITGEDIRQIYKEVSLSKGDFERYTTLFLDKLAVSDVSNLVK